MAGLLTPESFSSGTLPGAIVLQWGPPLSRGVTLDSSSVTVAGAAPDLHRLPVTPPHEVEKEQGRDCSRFALECLSFALRASSAEDVDVERDAEADLPMLLNLVEGEVQRDRHFLDQTIELPALGLLLEPWKRVQNLVG